MIKTYIKQQIKKQEEINNLIKIDYEALTDKDLIIPIKVEYAELLNEIEDFK
jgi:hypothetical protein